MVNSKSLIPKIKITGKTAAASNTKNVEIAVSLNSLRNFWRTLEMPLINYEINLILTWSEKCVISSAITATKFAITDTKLYVAAVTLSTGDNIKLLKQLESGFKRTIYWNKYQSKLTDQEQNRYFDHLINRNWRTK